MTELEYRDMDAEFEEIKAKVEKIEAEFEKLKAGGDKPIKKSWYNRDWVISIVNSIVIFSVLYFMTVMVIYLFLKN